MTYLEKLFVLLVIAGIAFYFGQRHGHSTGQAPAPVEFAQLPAAAASIDRPPALVQVVQPQRLPNPMADILASLRLKLSQWQESGKNDPDGEIYRAQLMQEMLTMITDANVAEIIQSLTAEEMNTPFGCGALHHWMKVDPLAASNWLAARPDTTENQTLAVAEDWAGNPDGLRQYLDQLPDSSWKENILQDASSEMSLTNPAEAVKLAQQMKPGDAQTNLLLAVASGWVSTDPNAALGWITSIKDPSLREQMTASAAQAYALTDPAQAAAWLVSEVKSDGIVKDSALNILSTWVATDPEAAADWAARFPEGDTKAAAVKVVASHWQQTDPDAANEWIQNLMQGAAAPEN